MGAPTNNPDTLQQIAHSYTLNKLWLDSESKTAFVHYFVETSGHENAYHNLSMLNAFINVHHHELLSDPTKDQTVDALFKMHQAIADQVPQGNMGIPSSFYAAHKESVNNAPVWVLDNDPTASGALDHYNYDLAIKHCFDWAFTSDDHAGSPTANGPITEYATQADAALACLGALFITLYG